MANATYKASTLFMACFLLSMAVRPLGAAAEIRHRVLFKLGAIGAVLLVFALVLVWNHAVGIRSSGDIVFFLFAVLAGLGLVGLGLGFLGQGLVLRRASGAVAAVLLWLMLLLVVVLILIANTKLLWILGLLTLAVQVVGGVSFLQSRGLAAPKLAVGTGVVFFTSAAMSLILLVFLEDGRFHLPAIVRFVMMGFAVTGLVSAFTLTGVHHLLVAWGPPRRSGMQDDSSVPAL
jgi:hypothetical protein